MNYSHSNARLQSILGTFENLKKVRNVPIYEEDLMRQSSSTVSRIVKYLLWLRPRGGGGHDPNHYPRLQELSWRTDNFSVVYHIWRSSVLAMGTTGFRFLPSAINSSPQISDLAMSLKANLPAFNPTFVGHSIDQELFNLWLSKCSLQLGIHHITNITKVRFNIVYSSQTSTADQSSAA